MPKVSNAAKLAEVQGKTVDRLIAGPAHRSRGAGL